MFGSTAGLTFKVEVGSPPPPPPPPPPLVGSPELGCVTTGVVLTGVVLTGVVLTGVVTFTFFFILGTARTTCVFGFTAVAPLYVPDLRALSSPAWALPKAALLMLAILGFQYLACLELGLFFISS